MSYDDDDGRIDVETVDDNDNGFDQIAEYLVDIPIKPDIKKLKYTKRTKIPINKVSSICWTFTNSIYLRKLVVDNTIYYELSRNPVTGRIRRFQFCGKDSINDVIDTMLKYCMRKHLKNIVFEEFDEFPSEFYKRRNEFDCCKVNELTIFISNSFHNWTVNTMCLLVDVFQPMKVKIAFRGPCRETSTIFNAQLLRRPEILSLERLVLTGRKTELSSDALLHIECKELVISHFDNELYPSIAAVNNLLKTWISGSRELLLLDFRHWEPQGFMVDVLKDISVKGKIPQNSSIMNSVLYMFNLSYTDVRVVVFGPDNFRFRVYKPRNAAELAYAQLKRYNRIKLDHCSTSEHLTPCCIYDPTCFKVNRPHVSYELQQETHYATKENSMAFDENVGNIQPYSDNEEDESTNAFYYYSLPEKKSRSCETFRLEMANDRSYMNPVILRGENFERTSNEKVYYERFENCTIDEHETKITHMLKPSLLPLIKFDAEMDDKIIEQEEFQNIGNSTLSPRTNCINEMDDERMEQEEFQLNVKPPRTPKISFHTEIDDKIIEQEEFQESHIDTYDERF